MGRTFAREEEEPGRRNVVILSHGFWKRRGCTIGSSLVLNGQVCTVVGVMPPAFRFPGWNDTWGIFFAPAWRTSKLCIQGSAPSEPSGGCEQVAVCEGPVRTGCSAVGLAQREPRPYGKRGAVVVDFHDDLTSVGSRRTLFLLLGASGLLLLIACAHVGGLLLTRALARGRETALRAALGADSWSMLRPFLVEGACIAGGGLALGIALAFASWKFLRPLIPTGGIAGHFQDSGLSPGR